MAEGIPTGDLGKGAYAPEQGKLKKAQEIKKRTSAESSSTQPKTFFDEAVTVAKKYNIELTVDASETKIGKPSWSGWGIVSWLVNKTSTLVADIILSKGNTQALRWVSEKTIRKLDPMKVLAKVTSEASGVISSDIHNALKTQLATAYVLTRSPEKRAAIETLYNRLTSRLISRLPDFQRHIHDPQAARKLIEDAKKPRVLHWIDLSKPNLVMRTEFRQGQMLHTPVEIIIREDGQLCYKFTQNGEVVTLTEKEYLQNVADSNEAQFKGPRMPLEHRRKQKKKSLPKQPPLSAAPMISTRQKKLSDQQQDIKPRKREQLESIPEEDKPIQ